MALRNIAWLLLLSTSLSAYAAEQGSYQQHTLPDGSIEAVFSNASGDKMRQVRKPDGTIETHIVDKQGNETTSVQHPDGKVEVNTKTN